MDGRLELDIGHGGLESSSGGLVSRFVFSTAVAAAMLGFLSLVLYRGVWLVAVVYLMAIAVAVIYYFPFRPELGVD